MKLLKQAMGVLGTVVMIAMIAALVAPKTAHALVATLVQVVNTSASPVPTSEVGRSNEPFMAELCIQNNISYCGSDPSSFTVPLTTADGKTVTRLVVTQVTGFCGTDGSGVPLIVLSTNLISPSENYFAAGGNNSAVWMLLSPKITGAGVDANQVLEPQNLNWMSDPGGEVRLNADPNSDVTYRVCNVSIQGYLAIQ